jgi:hypothetical protein
MCPDAEDLRSSAGRLYSRDVLFPRDLVVCIESGVDSRGKFIPESIRSLRSSEEVSVSRENLTLPSNVPRRLRVKLRLQV